MKARVRHSGELEDVVLWGDISAFHPERPRGWWDEEYAKGRMWFPGAVRACYAPGPPFGWDFVHADSTDYVTRDADGNLYVWNQRAFAEIYELCDTA